MLDRGRIGGIPGAYKLDRLPMPLVHGLLQLRREHEQPLEARDERTAQVAIGWQACRLAYQLVESLRLVFLAQLPVDVSQAHGDLLPLNRGHQRAIAGQRFCLAQDRLGGVHPVQANKALRRIERRLRTHRIGHGRAECGQVVHLLIGQSRQVERAR